MVRLGLGGSFLSFPFLSWVLRLFVCLFVCVFVCLCVCFFVYLFVCLFVFVFCMFIRLLHHAVMCFLFVCLLVCFDWFVHCQVFVLFVLFDLFDLFDLSVLFLIVNLPICLFVIFVYAFVMLYCVCLCYHYDRDCFSVFLSVCLYVVWPPLCLFAIRCTGIGLFFERGCVNVPEGAAGPIFLNVLVCVYMPSWWCSSSMHGAGGGVCGCGDVARMP